MGVYAVKQQYQANTNREQVHRSHIHMKPLGVTESDIRLEIWNFSEQFWLELRKKFELYLKIVRSEEITISLGHCSQLITILNLPNYHLIFDLIVSNPRFPAIRMWYFCMKLGEKSLCR